MGGDDEAARAALRLSLLAAPGGGRGCDRGLEPNSPFPSSRSPETFPGVCPMRSHRWGRKACDLQGPSAFVCSGSWLFFIPLTDGNSRAQEDSAGDPKNLRESCALLGRGPALRVLGQLEEKGMVASALPHPSTPLHSSWECPRGALAVPLSCSLTNPGHQGLGQGEARVRASPRLPSSHPCW